METRCNHSRTLLAMYIVTPKQHCPEHVFAAIFGTARDTLEFDLKHATQRKSSFSHRRRPEYCRRWSAIRLPECGLVLDYCGPRRGPQLA